MKELSIEEKAKRYELALERCRKLYNEAKANEYNSDIEDYETIFPELAESEDEKIIKDIISFLHSKNGYMNPDEDWDFHNRWLPCLEKQVKVKESIISQHDNKICKENDSLFHELTESEDERIRKGIIQYLEQSQFGEEHYQIDDDVVRNYIAWIEKQGHDGKKCIYKDVYLKEKEQLFQDGIDEVLENPQKYGLEKQDAITKLSEEEQNSIAYGVLTSCAMAFIDYLDAHKYEGKMCVSNGECEDIENAFHNAMFDRLHRYYCKYIEKQGEQEQLYIRFGEIPTDEKSKIFQGEIEVGTENGVSVYPAFKTSEGDIVLGLNLPITKTTLYTQQHLIEYDDRPCYLVRGDYVGKDTDGQTLINNVSIIEKINTYRVKEKKQRKQKPTEWSEEGEQMIRSIRCYLNEYGNWLSDKNEEKSQSVYKACDWLKSIKDRVLLQPKQGEQNPADKIEPKFKVKYADSEYNVFETKDIAGVTFYGIEDEPNHIDYVKAENCERVGGYSIKENGSPYPTKPATFSGYNFSDELEKQGEQKPTKNIMNVWKEMRLEVYAQASGNRHEPNCSDDNSKIFSLNDIDEIIEKMSEQKSKLKKTEL